MLHPEYLESLRRISPGDRLRMTLDLMDLGWAFLFLNPPQEIERRLRLARRPWNPPQALERR